MRQSPGFSVGCSNLEAGQPCSFALLSYFLSSFFFFSSLSLSKQILISSNAEASPKREHRKLLGRTSCNLVICAFLRVVDVESLSGRKVSYTSQIKRQEQQQCLLLWLPFEGRNSLLSVRMKSHGYQSQGSEFQKLALKLQRGRIHHFPVHRFWAGYLDIQRTGKQGTGLRHLVECWLYTCS